MDLLQTLQGKKTYIVGISMVVYAIIGFYLKQLDSASAILMGFNGLGIMGIRNGMTTHAEELLTVLTSKTSPPAPPAA